MHFTPCLQSLQLCNPRGDSLSISISPSEVDREHLCPRPIILLGYKQTPKSKIHKTRSQCRELLDCNMQLITEEEKRRKPYTSEKTIHENWVIDEKRKSARVSYTQRGDYLINRKSFETFWVATARNISVIIKLRLQSHKQLHSSRNVLCHWVSNTIVFPSFHNSGYSWGPITLVEMHEKLWLGSTEQASKIWNTLFLQPTSCTTFILFLYYSIRTLNFNCSMQNIRILRHANVSSCDSSLHRLNFRWTFSHNIRSRYCASMVASSQAWPFARTYCGPLPLSGLQLQAPLFLSFPLHVRSFPSSPSPDHPNTARCTLLWEPVHAASSWLVHCWIPCIVSICLCHCCVYATSVLDLVATSLTSWCSFVCCTKLAAFLLMSESSFSLWLFHKVMIKHSLLHHHILLVIHAVMFGQIFTWKVPSPHVRSQTKTTEALQEDHQLKIFRLQGSYLPLWKIGGENDVTNGGNDSTKEESSRVRTLRPDTRDPTVSECDLVLLQPDDVHMRPNSCFKVQRQFPVHTFVDNSTQQNQPLRKKKKRMTARVCSDTDTAPSNPSLRCCDTATQSSQNCFAGVETQFYTTTNCPHQITRLSQQLPNHQLPTL